MAKKAEKKKKPVTVKDFWDEQARIHGGSDLATAPDHHYRGLEIESAVRAISAMHPATILDVGCGNGYATKIIAQKIPDADVTGVDYSDAMIDEANISHNGSHIDYCVGDVLSLSRCPGLRGRKYDVVLSTRTLINLANWDEQKIGILEMSKMLNPEGHLVLIENMQDGLDNLNHIRKMFNLSAINPPWHNVYIPQDKFTKFCTEIKGHLLDVEYVENIGNMYYLMSRVVYAKLCQDMGKPVKYDNPINEIAAKLPTLGEFYAMSPNFMIIMKNVSEQWENKKLSS